MERYDQLYDLYERFDTGTLRAHQDFVDVFPAMDSTVALSYWEDATNALESQKREIEAAYPAVGDRLAEVAAYANRREAFTALDLLSKYDRAVNVLVLDVDETLRSTGDTDNEILRRPLHLLTRFHERGVPIVICTGQTLENVKGFLIQGLGNELVHSGDVSVVYEGGTGVFTPGHGAETKQLLYTDLDPAIHEVFEYLRAHALPDAPTGLQEALHLQGNEFNVTLKPNVETGSDRASAVMAEALAHLLDVLGQALYEQWERAIDESSMPDEEPGAWTRAYYADADPEIEAALESVDGGSRISKTTVPDAVRDVLERIDVAYYEADAVEVGSRELNKVVGVERALSVLGVDDPFALVMGDSKSDLRVMEWAEREGAGIAAAPDHASTEVLEHVRGTDDLVFAGGMADEPLRMAYALNCLAELDGID